MDTEDPPKIYFWKKELHSSRLQELNQKSLGNLSTIIMLSIWTLRIWFATHSLTNWGQTNRWLARPLFGQDGCSKTCCESASWLKVTFILMFIRLIAVTLVARCELQPFFTQALIEHKMVNRDGHRYLNLPRYCDNGSLGRWFFRMHWTMKKLRRRHHAEIILTGGWKQPKFKAHL